MTTQSGIEIPHYVMQSNDYLNLSAASKELMNWILYQYTGNNNGQLAIVWSHYRPILSFSSPHTFIKALKELVDNKLIVNVGMSNAGLKGRPCYLYAISWLTVGCCKYNSASVGELYREVWTQSETVLNFKMRRALSKPDK